MTITQSPAISPAAVLGTAAQLSPSEAAVAYATAGLAVFPCAPGAKRPLTHHGYLDATTALLQVRAWWGRWPNANIGLPTGRTDGHVAGGAGGFDVLDIDVHPSGSGFPALARARRASLVDGWAHVIRTPSGGLHLYYPARSGGGDEQESWSLPAVHVDFRGVGGYVIAPPSRATTTDRGPRSYTLIATGRDPHPLDASAVRHLLAPPADQSRRFGRGGLVASSTRLGAWLAGQPEGNRNRALFWAGCRAAEAGIAEAAARDILGSAAACTGLDEREISTTLASAYRTSARRPTANGPPPTAMDRPGP